MEDKGSFSKRYFRYLIIVELIIIILGCVMVVITEQITPIYWIITALGAEISVYSAFYLWKAKNENRAKYAQKFITELTEQYGADIAIRIAQLVLKE